MHEECPLNGVAVSGTVNDEMEQWLRLREVQPELHESAKWVTLMISEFHLFFLPKNLAFELSGVCDMCVLLVDMFFLEVLDVIQLEYKKKCLIRQIRDLL